MRHLLPLLLVSFVFASCSDETTIVVDTKPDCSSSLGANLHAIGLFDTDGTASGVAGTGDFVLVADGANGLVVADVTDPSAPSVATTLPVTFAADAAVSGDVAVVAAGDDGIVTVDISDPASASIATTVFTAGFAREVAMSGTKAYVVVDGVGLALFDVTDPAAPDTLGVDNSSGTGLSVAISGNIAFVSDSQLGIRVVSVEDPDAPWVVTSMATPGQTHGVAAAGAYLYVADGTLGVQVVDVSSPASPVIVGTADTPGSALDVAMSGNVLFVADRSRGVCTVDVSDPENPEVIGSSDSEGQTTRVAVAGGLTYSVSGTPGVRVFDTGTPRSAPAAARVEFTGKPRAIIEGGGNIFIADENAGVRIASVSGEGVALDDDVPVLGTAQDLFWYEGYLYVATGSPGVFIIDVNSIAGPTIVRTVSGSNGAIRCAVADSVVFMARGLGSPTAFDLVANYLPVVYPASGTYYNAVAIANEYVYFSEANQRVWIGRRDLEAPNLIASVLALVDRPRDIVVRDGKLFVAYAAGQLNTGTNLWTSARVDVFSLASELSPVFMGSIDTSIAAERIRFAGDLMFVSGQLDGFEVIDISDMSHPLYLGAYSSDTKINDALPATGRVHLIEEAGSVATFLLGCR